jgi:hypothetical protein
MFIVYFDNLILDMGYADYLKMEAHNTWGGCFE